MKTKMTLSVCASLLAFAATAAEDTTPATSLQPATDHYSMNDLSGRFGAGLLLGEPTGISVKYFMNDALALDGAFGWSFRDQTEPYLHSDFLWHKFDLLSVPRGQLPVYLGIGGWAKFNDPEDNSAGIRVPFGLSYIFDNLPLDIFAEVAPTVEFTPSTRGGFTAGVGARWWF